MSDAAGFDVAVVGAGVMGSSTAAALAAQGRKVVLLERFELGHKKGSSHGRSRIFRLSYPDAKYVAMAQEALELWRRLENDLGETLLKTTGGLDTGKRLDEHERALKEQSVPYELLEPQAAATRWPFMSFSDDQTLLFQPDAGIIAADRAWAAFARSATRAGAELREHHQVTGMTVGSDVTIHTDHGDVTADVVVVTAGAWASGLLATVGIELNTKPTRETVAYFEMEETLPPTLVDWGDPSVYALPSPGQGIKVGEHIAGPVTDPDEMGWLNRPSIARLQRWVQERFPSAEAEPHYAETCLYTNTPDEHFVLERHGPIVVGSPCSGHGFKFAPLIGERLAVLAS